MTEFGTPTKYKRQEEEGRGDTRCSILSYLGKKDCYNKIIVQTSYLLTCSRHENHQIFEFFIFLSKFYLLFVFCLIFLRRVLMSLYEDGAADWFDNSPYFWSSKKVIWTKFGGDKLENWRKWIGEKIPWMSYKIEI